MMVRLIKTIAIALKISSLRLPSVVSIIENSSDYFLKLQAGLCNQWVNLPVELYFLTFMPPQYVSSHSINARTALSIYFDLQSLGFLYLQQVANLY